jgi:hypothetical protein
MQISMTAIINSLTAATTLRFLEEAILTFSEGLSSIAVIITTGKITLFNP